MIFLNENYVFYHVLYDVDNSVEKLLGMMGRINFWTKLLYNVIILGSTANIVQVTKWISAHQNGMAEIGFYAWKPAKKQVHDKCILA